MSKVEKVLIDDTLVKITPKLLAEMWCGLTSAEQAEFFNEVANCVDTWKHQLGSFYMQMQFLFEEEGLSVEGRRILQIIGEYFPSYPDKADSETQPTGNS